jgi:hypothetical protein
MLELQDSEKMFSSVYLTEQINEFRKADNNSKVLLHFTLLAKIEKEFEEEIQDKKILEMLNIRGLPNGGSTKDKSYNLNFEQSLQLLMSESKIVRKGVVNKLKEQQEKINSVARPQTLKEALIAQIALIEHNEQLALQVENLDTALDSLLEWVSIIKVAKHNGVKETAFNWRVLKQVSEEMGFAIKKADSPRFGFQNLYNVKVFQRCYPQFKYDLRKLLNQ